MILRVDILLLSMLLAMNGCGKDRDERRPKTTSQDDGAENDDEAAGDSRKNELDRLEQEVRNATGVEDWSTARQKLAAGLKMSENRRGLERQYARLLRLLGDVERETGNEMEARRHYADSMALFHVKKDDTGRFETFLSKSLLEASIGDYAAAKRELKEAENLISKLKDRSLKGQYKLVEGRLCSRQVKPKEASDAIIEAILIFEAVKDHKSRAEALMLLAAEEDALGLLPASRRSLDKALALFTEMENLDGKARALHRLATYAEREHQYAKARRMFEEVQDLYDKLGLKSAAANVRLHLNSLPTQEGDEEKK